MAYIKNPTQEQRNEWKLAAKEKEEQARKMIEDLAEGYVNNPEQIAEMLEFGTKMYQYSPRNAMLIHEQNRGAVYVQSYKAWKDMGYSVKKGETAINVFVPVKTTYLKDGEEWVRLKDATEEQKEAYRNGKLEAVEKKHYKLGNVFDISQTNFPPENYPELFKVGYPSEQHATIYNGLKEYYEAKLGYKVETAKLNSISLRGNCNCITKCIKINELLKDTQKLSTLAHEGGHAMEREAGSSMDRGTAYHEFVADSLGIMVEANFGLEITDARRRHLANCFSQMKEEIESAGEKFELEKIFGDIYDIYKDNITGIEQCVEEHLSREYKKVEMQESVVMDNTEREVFQGVMEDKTELMQQNHTEKMRLIVDMDGTLARFHPVDTLETLYEKGYFLNLEPQQNVVDAVKEIIQNHPEKQVYIMSATLSDSPYALQEKNAWLDKYLPEIDAEHRIFPPCGENKLNYVPEGIRKTDHLLDDYTNNLVVWEPPAKGIKLLNGINHTNESWKGNMLRYDKEPKELAQNIVDIMDGKEQIQDERPIHQQIEKENSIYDQKVKLGYIAEEIVENLKFLTKEQALEALKEGIHVCSINDHVEYHGIHENEYGIRELRDEKDIRELYATHGAGIVHKACISPYYDKPETLKKLVTDNCRNSGDVQIKKELTKAGYHPTNSLVNKMKELNAITGRDNSLKDIEKKYKNKEFNSIQEKGLIDGIAKECRTQEQLQVEKTVLLELQK